MEYIPVVFDTYYMEYDFNKKMRIHISNLDEISFSNV
jgi:hypothetical protein